MNADDILNNTDPRELRNLLRRMKVNTEAFQRPVPNIIINQAPQQFPPPSTTIINKLPWINVKDYGAIGDGTTDDTAAINTAITALNTAARGVLYFPAGAYKCSSGLTTITADCLILGDGSASWDESTYNSRVICTSGTAVLFTITAAHAKFVDIELSNTASTPSAGAGIQVSGANSSQKVDYDGVRVNSFYINIDIQVGISWMMDNCMLRAPVLYAVKIRNTLNTVGGGWTIANCSFHAATYNSDAAIRIESTGAGRILNCDINYGGGGSFNHGIDLNSSVSGFLIIADCVIQNLRGHGIKGAGSFDYITVDGVQFGLSYAVSNNTGNCININGIDGVVITGCTFVGGTTPAAISLTSVNTARVVGNVNLTFSSLITQMSCTNVVIIEPATAVVTETSYGQSSAVGTDKTGYALPDHTHGTPSLGSSVTAETSYDLPSSAGSGTTASKADHTHGTPSLGSSVTAETSYGLPSSAGSGTTASKADHTHGSPALSTATPADVGSSGSAGSGTTPSRNDHVHKGVTSVNGSYGDVIVASGAGQVTGIDRWSSGGGTIFDLTDISEYLVQVSDNGSLVDPLTYSLSNDRTQIVFDSAITAGHVVTSEYIVAQV